MSEIVLRPVGRVESPLTLRENAPRQPDEDGAPAAAVVIDEAYRAALVDVRPGDDLVLVTWLHEAARDVLVVRPRGDASRPPTGVFSTRSPDRPNPLGLHTVRVVAVVGTRLEVAGLEAIDGTPVLDVKPVLDRRVTRR